MAVDIVTETIIDRPLAVVAAYAGDPDNAPEWYVNIKSVEWMAPPPIAVGSRLAFVAHFLGRRLAYTYGIIELVPGERLVMRTSEGPFPMETTYSWAALGAEPLGNWSTRRVDRHALRAGLGVLRRLDHHHDSRAKRCRREVPSRCRTRISKPNDAGARREISEFC